MDLSTYIADPSARKALADAVGSSPDYLWQVATGWNGRQASPKLAQKIEQATDGKVTRAELRPDLWGDAKPKTKRAA